MLPPGRYAVGRLIALLLPLLGGAVTMANAQSGRAGLNGWVAFEGVAYVDPQPQATVELRREGDDSGIVYTTHTDAHGFYSFSVASLGAFVLRITAPHFEVYEARVYLPSDFIGNWAVLLKTERATRPGRKPAG
jgi:hypothetical protein